MHHILPLKQATLIMVKHLYHFPQTKNRSDNRFSSSPDPLSRDFYFQKGSSSCLLLLSLACTLYVCSETILSPTKWKGVFRFLCKIGCFKVTFAIYCYQSISIRSIFIMFYVMSNQKFEDKRYIFFLILQCIVYLGVFFVWLSY